MWFDYARLEEGAYRDLKEEGATEEEEEQSVGRVREVYERAVAQVPPGDQKRHWRRYIFLWLNYALFEEIETKVCVFYNILVVHADQISCRTMLGRVKYIKPLCN